MKMSEQIKNIATALAKFQEEVPNPKTVADNPFFKSKYAPLDEVINVAKPYLAKNGLSYFQTAGGDGKNITVTTLLMHTSGEWIESDPLTVIATKPDPQQAGSAITYARRYSLSAILGIASEEDDDGNSSSGKKESKPPVMITDKTKKKLDELATEYAELKEGNKEDLIKYYLAKGKVETLEKFTEAQGLWVVAELGKLVDKEKKARN